MFYYAGIGSRKTPKEVCDLMSQVAQELYLRGGVLRTGGAEGADQAFIAGILNLSNLSKLNGAMAIYPVAAEVYLPWTSFINGQNPEFDRRISEANNAGFGINQILLQDWAQTETYNEADKSQKDFFDQRPGVLRLYSRNKHQIYGVDKTKPKSSFVIYWAERNEYTHKVKGGTGVAIAIAEKANVPCLNLINYPKATYIDVVNAVVPIILQNEQKEN